MARNFLCVEYYETKQLHVCRLLDTLHSYNVDLGGMAQALQGSIPVPSPCHTGKVDIMLTKI